MKKQIKKLIAFAVITNLIFFTCLSLYGIHQDKLQLARDAKENQIFNDGIEKGRFDQLNEQAVETDCLNSVSKNPELNVLLKKYFGNCDDAKKVWAIAQAESGGKQVSIGKNHNGTLDCGWLQNNTVHKKKGETDQAFCKRMSILEENVATAKQIKDKEGWTAWVTYKTNAYLTYLK